MDRKRRNCERSVIQIHDIDGSMRHRLDFDMRLVDISFPQAHDQSFAFLTFSSRNTPGIIKTLNLEGDPVVTTWRDTFLATLGGTSTSEFSTELVPHPQPKDGDARPSFLIFRHRDTLEDGLIVLDG